MTRERRLKKDRTALFQQEDENIISGTAIDLVPEPEK